MPRLLVTLPDGSEQTHELTEDLVTVGRVSDNTIQIEDASVSSHHAELVFAGSDYILRDIGSTNGSRYNGAPLEPNVERNLQDGDQIRFGSIEVRYASETAAEQRPLPTGSEPAMVPAESSVRPADFANASPFQSKKKKKDPAAMAIMAFAVVAILAFAGAVALVFTMQAPIPAS